MKKLLPILCVFLFYGCIKDAPIDKAKKLVEKDLSVSLNDFKSYEPVEYGTLDSAFSEYKDSSMYRIDTASQAEISLRIQKEREAFKPEFVGYKLGHSFRSKNSLGAVVLSHYVFYFDPQITKVEDRKDEQERPSF